MQYSWVQQISAWYIQTWQGTYCQFLFPTISFEFWVWAARNFHKRAWSHGNDSSIILLKNRRLKSVPSSWRGVQLPADILPPIWNCQSELFTVQCCQWEPIWNSQLIRIYKKIPVQWQIYRYIETNTQLDTIGRWTPQFETARVQSELFAVQCHQWEPIQNSQLIRKYKKIPVQWQIYRYIETNTQLDTISRWTPQSIKQRYLPYHYTNYWIYCTYRYQRQMDPPGQSSRDACHTTTPDKFYYWIYCTYRYQRQMTPHQSSRDACHTTTPTTGSIAHIDTKGRWTPQRDSWRQMHSGIEYYGMSLVAILKRVRICSRVCFKDLSQINNLQQSVFQGF